MQEWFVVSKLPKQDIRVRRDQHGYRTLKFMCLCGHEHESDVRTLYLEPLR